MAVEEPKSNTSLAKVETGNRGLVLTNLDDMQMTAQLILQSGLCPDGYKTKAQVFVGIQAGAEMGLKPMQALNSIAIIHGRPTLWGDAALGLVKKSGLLLKGPTGYTEEVTGEGDNMVAKVVSVRIDGSKVTTTFSVEDAKIAGLWNKAGTWKTHPKRMLKYKARAFNLRDNFPDVLMGLHLTEELIGEEALPAPECDTPPRAVRRKKVDSQDVESTEATESLAEPVTEAVKDDEGSAGSLYLEVTKIYDDLGGETFVEWAAEVLSRGEEEVESPEQFTDEMLEQLKRHLAEEGV